MANEKTANRLLHETSPYLLQHAHNPVNWWPWCEEAFETAERKNRPIFLSIGYSTCHWCHVMAHESFEDPEVAAYLNAHFLAIKVDREERPDIDAIYMTACQAMTGGGGWPLTALLASNKEPFFTGTYFPKHTKYGRIGLLELLETVVQRWQTDKSALLHTAHEVTAALTAINAKRGEGASPDRELTEKIAGSLAAGFDARFGGFGNAPKFPTPHALLFLLRYFAMAGDERALVMSESTLRHMWRGGIFDHIGYGFSRYSTDAQWLIPHFEKMLYDNALLCIAYIECFQATGDVFFKQIAQQILDYVNAEMTAPGGAFYSAQDADSEGIEGKYYAFTPVEIQSALGKKDAADFCRHFGITAQGNFDGKSIPNLLHATDQDVQEHARFARMRETLYLYRLNRTNLHKDDKVLTAWNALMIVAYCKAFHATGKQEYFDKAAAAYAFISTHLFTDADKALTSWRDGKASGEGTLDDYAFMIWACLELYAVSFAPCYIFRAIRLAERVETLFKDESGGGGFFLSAQNAGKLPFRPKETYDGALPSGNSVMAHCLNKLAVLTAESRWIDAAEAQISFLAAHARELPQGHTFTGIALLESVYPTKEVVCLARDQVVLEEFVSGLGSLYRPNLSVLAATEEQRVKLQTACPYLKEYSLPKGETCAIYICEDGSCSQPMFHIKEAFALL